MIADMYSKYNSYRQQQNASKTVRSTGNNGIAIWLVLQSFTIIFATIFAYLVVEFGARYFFKVDRPISAGYVFGLLIPLLFVLNILNQLLMKYAFQYFTTLTEAIKRVSDGDFSTRLDERRAGPFLSVFENFNRMSDELQNVHMLRSDFINSYSHEFKTPITSINGFANLLLETEVTEADRNRYLQIIADESARLAELANSTILLSKLDSQQIITEKKPYSLDEQLRRCGILLSKNWYEKNIDLSGELDEVIYNGNAELLQHVWLNLIGNAIKFTPEGGKIFIRLTEKKGQAIVEISDNGMGMSEETAAHIFERYYQGTDLSSRKGLGLGLAIASRIVDLCGGTIEVKSKETEGSTFIVKLPNL